MLSVEDTTADLRKMLEQWIDIAGDRPLLPIQTGRVAMWLRKLGELEDSLAANRFQPFA